MQRFPYCQKDSILFSNNIDKAKFKMELEAFGRMLCLKWHFHNENKDIHCDMFKPKSKFNPCNKDAAIELYLSSLEEKLMKVELLLLIFSKLEIQTFNSKQIFYLNQYCRDAITEIDFVFYDV